MTRRKLERGGLGSWQSKLGVLVPSMLERQFQASRCRLCPCRIHPNGNCASSGEGSKADDRTNKSGKVCSCECDCLHAWRYSLGAIRVTLMCPFQVVSNSCTGDSAEIRWPVLRISRKQKPCLVGGEYLLQNKRETSIDRKIFSWRCAIPEGMTNPFVGLLTP